MSIYVYRDTSEWVDGVCKEKIRFFMCNDCGSVDLEHPRSSEADHRDVLRFSCKKCGTQPYFRHSDIYDVIKLTPKNAEQIKKEFCEQRGWKVEDREYNAELQKIIMGETDD